MSLEPTRVTTPLAESPRVLHALRILSAAPKSAVSNGSNAPWTSNFAMPVYPPSPTDCSEAAQGFYVRVQLPTGDTTVILANESTSISEVVQSVETKKSISISHWSVSIALPGGKKLDADPEQTLSNFKDIDKVIISGIIVAPLPLDSEATAYVSGSLGRRRGSTLSAPSTKVTSTRANSEIYSTVSLDQSDGASLKGSARLKSGFKTALSAMFGKRVIPDHKLRMSIIERSTDSINRSSSPSSASIWNEKHYHYINTTASSSRKSTPSLNNLLTDQFDSILNVARAENSTNSCSLLNSDDPPLDIQGKDDSRDFQYPDTLVSQSTISQNLSNSYASTIMDQKFESDPCTPSLHFRELQETMDEEGLAIHIHLAEPSVSEETKDMPGLPMSMRSTTSMSASRGRRRSYSQPVARPEMVATLRRRNVESDNSSVILSNTDVNSPMVLVKVHYIDDSCLVLKIASNLSLEQLLANICKRRGYDFNAHSFEFADKSIPAELDRRVDYFIKDNNQLEIFVVKRQKLYSTICISENGVNVMLVQVVNGKSQIIAVSKEKLFETLTDTQQNDESFMDMILLTFRSFITPIEFFDQLVARFYCELPDNPTQEDIDFFDSMKIPTQRRVLFVIQWWVEHHWHDFGLSSQFRQHLNGFLKEVLECRHADFEQECRELIRIVDNQWQWYEDLLSTYTLGGERRAKTIESMFFDLEPVDIAQQLCIHNHGIFKSIHPIEFLNEIWSGDADSSPSFKFFVERFDKESYWVATELVKVRDIKKRTLILKKFVQLVKESLNLNNFFSTFSLIAGLNLTPVQRLKKTWEALPDKTKKLWAEVEKIADPSRNMKNYRDRLAASSSPMVPFLPIYLKDLTFINDGNQSKISGMINVEKLRMMSSRVLEITSISRSAYSLESKPAILNYLEKPPVERNIAKLKDLATEIEGDIKQ
ncbi:hypothetical protein BASA50_000421 [Batrachochytrium salamandrivorans]|uniref:Ras-GEF domain-containing protein n=1 Tax=Batrachochytrium salamandrivorans TaxID=1357716 RepID=A0ABQ8ETT3_9FUNG|nr:hypothetical protein BASA50_000421 [Batrachochytrium salamandrivorans]KAH9275467.1 hypothetical protein BASA83_002241 [Batrachochytrium salamandrivorans]